MTVAIGCASATVTGPASHSFPKLEPNALCACGQRYVGLPDIEPATRAFSGLYVDPPGVIYLIDDGDA